MSRTAVRLIVVSACALAFILARAPDAAAQDGGAVVVQDVHRLGGSTAFYRTPLTTVASFKRMSADPRVVANIRAVLDQAGLSSLATPVVAAFTGATTSVVGGLCADATPIDGVLVECDVPPGQTLQWMAHRPRGGEPALLTNIRWMGARPFHAYLFRVTDGRRVYSFVVPKVCGNVSLLQMEERPATVVAAIAPPPPPPPPPPMPAPAAPPTLVQEPAPTPPPTFEQAPAPMTSTPAPRATPFFVDGLFGKERRVRPVDGAVDAAQCSPLAGVKLGASKRFQNDWELGGAVGMAFSLVTADDKVREHALFLDVEANKYVGGGNVFLGAGLSWWDLTHSDTAAPAAMVHLGLPIAPHARFPVFFLVEGRLFLDALDEIDNNYQFWGGVRIRF